MSESLRGKTAVVTGAAGGIGRAACEVMAREGAAIVAVDLAAEVQEVADDLTAAGTTAVAVRADVSEPEGVEAYLVAADALGGLDLLFNNAGIFADAQPLIDYPVATFDDIIKVNVRGVWLGMRGAFGRMAPRGGGVIVNTASVAGLRGYAGVGPYVTSKHAVIGLTRHGAAEGGPLGIRVLAVCPGTTDTAMGDAVERMFGGPEAFAEYVERTTPLNRLGQPSDVAEMVAFLMSDRASYMNGAAIPIDGGIEAVG